MKRKCSQILVRHPYLRKLNGVVYSSSGKGRLACVGRRNWHGDPTSDRFFFFLTDLIRLERSLKRGLLSHHVTHSAEYCGCGNLKPHFLAWVWLIHYLGNSGLSETKQY